MRMVEALREQRHSCWVKHACLFRIEKSVK
jgi:hypothetical protein